MRKVMGWKLHGLMLFLVEAVWLVSLHPEGEWVWNLSIFVALVVWVFCLQVWLRMMWGWKACAGFLWWLVNELVNARYRSNVCVGSSGCFYPLVVCGVSSMEIWILLHNYPSFVVRKSLPIGIQAHYNL